MVLDSSIPSEISSSRNITLFKRPRSRIYVGLPRFGVACGSHGTGHLHISPILSLAPTCRSVRTSNPRTIISNNHMFFHMKPHADLHFVFRCAEWGIPAHLTVLAAWSPRWCVQSPTSRDLDGVAVGLAELWSTSRSPSTPEYFFLICLWTSSILSGHSIACRNADSMD